MPQTNSSFLIIISFLIFQLLSHTVKSQSSISIPKDTSAIQLKTKQIINDNQSALTIERKSYIISEAQFNKIAEYESTLLKVRKVLINAVNELDSSKTIINNLEKKLKAAGDVVGEGMTADIEKLKTLERELTTSHKELGKTNVELEGVEKNLQKASKKLKKRKKAEKIIRTIIGGIGVGVGVLIGGLVFN